MTWFLNLSIRNKLFLTLGGILALLAVVIVDAYTGISTIREGQRRLYEEDYANVHDLLTVDAANNSNRAAVLTLLNATDPAQQAQWLESIKEKSAENAALLERLATRNQADRLLSEKLKAYANLRALYAKTRDEEVLPSLASGDVETARALTIGIQDERFMSMQAMREEMISQVSQSAETELQASKTRAANSVRVFASLGAVALVLGLLMAVFLNRIIATPLKNLSTGAMRIATGDLTMQIGAMDRNDEVGMLNEGFREMTERLRELHRRLREGVGVLASSASEIVASTTQVASSAAETATAVSETTTTVEEVKQTAHLSNQKAKVVSETAQKAAQVAQGGRGAVEQSIQGMERIREQMEAIAGVVVRLSEQGQAIGEIIATVNDLAEQSNLLAVNAAIEAARAGEQGKGFGVVAQEVKNLAEQSKQATAQVRSILGDIQKATSAAVLATEQGSRAVENGTKQAGEAGQAIRQLSESISEAAQAATQIAASNQQQLAGMDQVALAMENINQASNQNVTGTKQTEQAARNLQELGQELKEMIEQYRV